MAVLYELTKAHRLRLAKAFRDHARVDLSIDCVVEGQMGEAWVDDALQPQSFMIRIGPFYYFAGEASGIGARALLQEFPAYSLLMAPSTEWLAAVREMHGKMLVEFPRYSFSAQNLSFDHLDRMLEGSEWAAAVERFDAELLALALKDPEEGFVDISGFDSPEDFLERGIGYGIRRDGILVGAAYSSLVCGGGIEISLFVLPEWRRKGIATALAGKLLCECLTYNLKPHWDAANLESCKLAEKLGYAPLGSYRSYYWVARD